MRRHRCRPSFLQLVLVALTLTGVACACAEAAPPDEDIRPPCCAGSWYPKDRGTLEKMVDDLLERAHPPTITRKPLAVIAPHAGYNFSAPVAAAGYETLRGHDYKRVIVLAFSHRYAHTYDGVDVPKTLTAYETPLGPVPIDREVCDQLLKDKLFASHGDVGREEHSLELQLPFLQRVVPGFKLVPLLVGEMSVRDYTRAAEKIRPWVDEETLLVVSSDFTHFGRDYGYRPFNEEIPEHLTALADQAFKPLADADFDGFVEHLETTKDTICGRGPILLLLRLLSMKGGATGVRTAVDTSGRMMNDWNNSVTYQSVVFLPRLGSLSHEERVTLLQLARETITTHLSGGKTIRLDPADLPAKLRDAGASFVTLTNQGNLRGCIGNMVAGGPLWQSVVHNAVAASEDYRFARNPVTTKELPVLEIEVSYLTPLVKVTRPEEVVIGRDGLLIEWRGQSGVLLPQVAYELGWTRQEFLEQVCRKAGLPSGTWKREDAELYAFQAEVFGEADEGIH